MMEIMKRDKNSLQKSLDEKTDYKKVLSLEDCLVLEEKKNKAQANEIKLLQKMLDEHNRKCLNKNTADEKENQINQIRDDLKLAKDKNKDFIQKLKDEEEKYNEMRNKFYELQKMYDKAKQFLPKDEEEKIKKNIFKPYNNNKLLDKSLLEEKNRSKSRGNSPGSHSGSNTIKSTKKKQLYQEENKRLFTSQELTKLEKLLTKNELEKLEKRYDTVDHRGIVLEKKYNSDFKVLNKKYRDLEDQVEFVSLQLKEAEQRAKIYQFQGHEHKAENKNISKRLTELQSNYEIIQKALHDKDQESKILISRIQETQKENEILKRKIDSFEKEKNANSKRRKENTGEEDEEEDRSNPQKNKIIDDDYDNNNIDEDL
jgi:hypothetical protein